MSTRFLSAALLVLSVLVAGPALGDFLFQSVYTLDPLADGVDGRIYDETGTCLVKDGALVQFIVAIGGSPIVDPMEYFDYNHNGLIDASQESVDLCQWLENGADPAEISGGTNVLCYDLVETPFTGEFETVGGKVALDVGGAKQVDWHWLFPPWGPAAEPVVQNGMGADSLAYRAWNLTKEELQTLPLGLPLGQEVWYMTNTERGWSDGIFAPPDSGMCIGAGWLAPGEDPIPVGWEFCPVLGVEVYLGVREKNQLDTRLTPIIPEPAGVALGGCGLLLMLVRRKRRGT